METSRLKNIIILTLALVNLFLLGTLSVRRIAQVQGRQQAVEELVALFARNDMALSEEAVSFDAPPQGRVLSRSLSAEQAMAAAFLGEDLSAADEGGGIFTAASGAGRAQFRASGSFEITGNLGGGAAGLIRGFCKDYGCADPELALDASGTGTAAAQQLYEGYPVAGCSVRFFAENDQLRAVSGTFLPAASTPGQESGSLSGVTALTTFLEARRSSGAVATSVTAAYPCYTLQSTAAAPMVLAPVWCVVTDTANYYVDCATGAVSTF